MIELKPICDLLPGAVIAGDRIPPSIVDHVEFNGKNSYRVYYTTHGPTEWFLPGELFPVVVGEES